MTDECKVSEREVCESLIGILECTDEDEPFELFENCSTRTFSEGGYLTGNKGFVVELANGERFQISVVKED